MTHLRPPQRCRLAVACALIIGLAAAPAHAGGTNDWFGGVVDRGELWIVPQAQWTLKPRLQQLYTLQLQTGFGHGWDAIVAVATALEGGQNEVWPTYIMPRWAPFEGFSISPGFIIPATADADGLALYPGVYHSVTDASERWIFTWNAALTVPLTAPGDTSLFAVAVGERVLNTWLRVFVELDVDTPFTDIGSAASLTALTGVQFELSDTTELNLALGLPLRPEVDPAGTSLNVWYAHGLNW